MRTSAVLVTTERPPRHTGEKSGPNGWGINTDAHITVTVANGAKVVGNFPFTTINETDVDKVKESLKKALKK